MTDSNKDSFAKSYFILKKSLRTQNFQFFHSSRYYIELNALYLLSPFSKLNSYFLGTKNDISIKTSKKALFIMFFTK